MGQLYSLDTAAAVRRYIERTSRAVRAGRILPGSDLALRDAADELGVRWSGFRAQFDQLERDGLLAVGASGTATVAPLDPSEVEAIGGLMRATVPPLLAQAATRITPVVARRIERDGATIDHLPLDDRYEMMTNVLADLLAPSGNSPALEQFRMLSAGLERYHHLGICDLIEKQDEEFFQFRDSREQLHRASVRGDAGEVYRVTEKLIAAFVRFGAHSLTVAPVANPRSRAFPNPTPILRLV